jgi:hypothetical protein
MSVPHIRFLEVWRRYRNLSQEDRGLVLRGMVLLSLTVLGLRTMSFRRCKELICQFSLTAPFPRQIPAVPQTEERMKLVSAMNAVERNGPWQPNCLERSLALWWLFQLNAVEGELRIGGRKDQGRFEAHAWVECDGQVLNDTTDVHKHYSRFDAPIAAAEGNLRVAGEAASHPGGKAGSHAADKAAS